MLSLVSSELLPREARASAPVLRCELSDLSTGRLLEIEQDEIPAASAKPVLFLFGYRSVTGHVRDVAIQAPERRIELELFYREGGSTGTSVAQAQYDPAQAREEPLAEVTLAEPWLGRLLSLRCWIRR